MYIYIAPELFAHRRANYERLGPLELEKRGIDGEKSGLQGSFAGEKMRRLFDDEAVGGKKLLIFARGRRGERCIIYHRDDQVMGV